MGWEEELNWGVRFGKGKSKRESIYRNGVIGDHISPVDGEEFQDFLETT